MPETRGVGTAILGGMCLVAVVVLSSQPGDYVVDRLESAALDQFDIHGGQLEDEFFLDPTDRATSISSNRNHHLTKKPKTDQRTQLQKISFQHQAKVSEQQRALFEPLQTFETRHHRTSLRQEAPITSQSIAGPMPRLSHRPTTTDRSIEAELKEDISRHYDPVEERNVLGDSIFFPTSRNNIFDNRRKQQAATSSLRDAKRRHDG